MKDLEQESLRLRGKAAESWTSQIDRAAELLESPIERALFWALAASAERCSLVWLLESMAVFLPVLQQLAGPEAEAGQSQSAQAEPARPSPDPSPPTHQVGSGEMRGHRPAVKLITDTGYVLELVPQFPVNAGGKTYRLDMAIGLEGHMLGVKVPLFLVDVECDGHEYHERTKEQAERDKARDRDLQVAGWHVARFTGAEIYRSPEAAAGKVIGFIEGLAESYLRKQRDGAESDREKKR